MRGSCSTRCGRRSWPGRDRGRPRSLRRAGRGGVDDAEEPLRERLRAVDGRDPARTAGRGHRARQRRRLSRARAQRGRPRRGRAPDGAGEDATARAFLAEREVKGEAQGELTLKRGSGERFTAQVSSGALGDGLLYVIFRDVTARRVDEERLRRSNRALLLVSRCNEALVRAESERELYDLVCRGIVEAGGYAMCWVGLARSPSAATSPRTRSCCRGRTGPSRTASAAPPRCRSRWAACAWAPSPCTRERGRPSTTRSFSSSPGWRRTCRSGCGACGSARRSV